MNTPSTNNGSDPLAESFTVYAGNLVTHLVMLTLAVVGGYAADRGLRELSLPLPEVDDIVGRVIIGAGTGVFVYATLILLRWAHITRRELGHGVQSARHRCWLRFIQPLPETKRPQALDELTERELSLLERRYEFPGLLLWVLPILGFIGTVWGISVAIDQFKMASDLDALQTAIPKVMDGLGSAFMTTLVCLVLSVPLMFLRSTVHRREESSVDRTRERLFSGVVLQSDADSGSARVAETRLEGLIEANNHLSRRLNELTSLLETLRQEETALPTGGAAIRATEE